MLVEVWGLAVQHFARVPLDMMGQNNIGSKKVSVYFKTSLMSQIIHLEYNEKDCLNIA